MERFKGVFPALLTPFDSEGRVNEKALEALVEMNLKKGVKGFYVGGSTAEAFLLTESEREGIYKSVAEVVNKRCTLIAHVGCPGTLQTIHFAKIAEKCGYDAVSSVAPFYYKYSAEEIRAHYNAVVDSVSLPMIIYNIPAFSGVSMSTADVCKYFEDDRFIGIKHTSNDFFALEQYKSARPDKIVYNGYDEMFLAGLSMGADGGIGSTYNFMAEKFIEIERLFKACEIDAAREVQKVANKIIAVLCKVGVMQGEKAVLTLMGYDFGDCRPPFKKLSKDDIKLIEKEIMPLL